ncbi:uncharacterized protein LOC109793549 isoform X2 [Cajanus cajan]|nr:uncharacterized protein LOC109793549 isoform X2 [Cajanus cajan]
MVDPWEANQSTYQRTLTVLSRDALIGIKNLFIRYPEEQRLNKYTAIEKLRERICDDDKVVRKSLYDLFKVVILPGCKEDYDLVKSYVSKIQEMEGELQRLENSNAKSRHFVDWVDSDDSGFQSKNALFACDNEYSSDCDAKVDIIGRILAVVLMNYCMMYP